LKISSTAVSGNEFYLKVKVSKGGICDFSYQTEKGSGHLLKSIYSKTRPLGRSEVGLFCSRTNITNDAGFADVDWFRIEKVMNVVMNGSQQNSISTKHLIIYE
jgi:hypothetical protein